MRLSYNSDLKAQLVLDNEGCVKSINHFQKHWLSRKKSPRLVAVDYLDHMSYLFNVPKENLRNLQFKESFLSPKEQGIEYRLSNEKLLFDSTIVSFCQTYLNIPVWHSGFSIMVKHKPYRVIRAVNSSKKCPDAKLPASELIERFKKLFAFAAANKKTLDSDENDKIQYARIVNFIRNLIDESKLNRIVDEDMTKEEYVKLNRGKFYVYRYEENNRIHDSKKRSQPNNGSIKGKDSFNSFRKNLRPELPLKPVPKSIQDGNYYIVAEIIFTFPTTKYNHANWLALVELETNSILYLRPLGGSENGSADVSAEGMIFKFDPITTTGDITITAAQSNEILNPLRIHVALPNLKGIDASLQPLTGVHATIKKDDDDKATPPAKPIGEQFNFDVRTWDFAAVNAYYHVENFFDELEELGFYPRENYFPKTKFPIIVQHSSWTGDSSCWGDGDGIERVWFSLNYPTGWDDPVGRACDSRVTWHELGGHGILYDNGLNGNLRFSHSAGDSLSMIRHDPESNAPDKFRYAPWSLHPLLENRRADLDVASGGSWGGVLDDGDYGSESILATTLFRVYRSIGGESNDLSRRKFASRTMLHLIFTTIFGLNPQNNPETAMDFADDLMASDAITWTTEGICGGAYSKVIRWAFEKQGMYQLPGTPYPIIAEGQPPDVDVYIDDGRGGEYQFQPVHWLNTSIWNRRQADGEVEIEHEEPAIDAVNYAYVKIKNRGIQTANDVIVKGFHCRPSAGLIWPEDFQELSTAEIFVGELLGEDKQDLTVGPFEWMPVTNTYGHDCILMIVSADGDASNIDNLAPGETISEWRLVPNDNNIGQRNVVIAPGGGGKNGLNQGLNGYSFFVGNPSLESSSMELRVHLPQFLSTLGWTLSFRGLPENKFELLPREKREVVIELHPGGDFDKDMVAGTTERDIEIGVYSNEALIGGMNYRLDPEIKEPFNKRYPATEENFWIKCLCKHRWALMLLLLILILLLINIGLLIINRRI